MPTTLEIPGFLSAHSRSQQVPHDKLRHSEASVRCDAPHTCSWCGAKAEAGAKFCPKCTAWYLGDWKLFRELDRPGA